MGIVNFILKIYNQLIIFAGLIAFFALLIGGIIYLTSAGDPEKLKKAQKQVLAAFWGIIILLSSYLILRTINPQLAVLNVPTLIPINFSPISLPPGQEKTPVLFNKIKEIANNAKLASEAIESSAKEINDLTEKCDCKNTLALCACNGGNEGARCEPKKCYSQNSGQPCPDGPQIKEDQALVVAWKNEIFYYKNRAPAEANDLDEEINKVLRERVDYYQEKLKTEKDDKIREEFQQQINNLNKEIELKQKLAEKLKEFAVLAEKLLPFVSQISSLPEKCFSDIEQKCQAHCKGGCHDIKEGCQPEPKECDGGNPCPSQEVQNQLSGIQDLKPQIIQTSQELLNIIDEITKLKTIYL